MTETTDGSSRPLGMQWGSADADVLEDSFVQTVTANTRTSLWPERWPAIALQECIDLVEAAPPQQRAEVKYALPCQDCSENTRCLNAKRKGMGALLYDREIQTSPRSSESTLFPRELWAPMLMKDQNLVPYWHKPFSMESDYGVCQAWDIAWSERVGGDFLVCETGYVHRPSGRRHLLDIERWRGKTFDDQVGLIQAKWSQYQADLVVIEGDAAQKVWRQHIGRNTAVPVLSHEASGKTDLASGVPGLLILLENRKWEIPYRRGSHRFEEVETMLNEFEAFGWNDGKLEGVGEHDDTVMCFWHLNWGLDRLLHWGEKGGREFSRGNVPGSRQ